MLRSVLHVHKARSSGESARAGNKEQIKQWDLSAFCSAVRNRLTNGLGLNNIGQKSEFKELTPFV